MSENWEPPVKAPKNVTDYSKCAKCSKILRKDARTSKKEKIINSREEAKIFTKDYDFFVQIGDVLCDRCYAHLRLSRSKVQRKVPNLSGSSTTISPRSFLSNSPTIPENENISTGPMLMDSLDFPSLSETLMPPASQSTEPLFSAPIEKVDSKCVKCSKNLRKDARTSRKDKIINSREEARVFAEDYDFFVQIGDILCERCYAHLRLSRSKVQNKALNLPPTIPEGENISSAHMSKSSQDISVLNESQCSSKLQSQDFLSLSETSTLSASQKTDSSFSASIEKDSLETVFMQLDRVASSKSYCFLCLSKAGLRDVPQEARIQVFVKRRIFIPKRNRCCKDHLLGSRFYENELRKIEVYDNECEIEAGEVKIFLERLSSVADERVIDKFINPKMFSEERVKSFTGHSLTNVLALREMLTTMRDSENRSVLQALVIFLFKLKSGNSDNIIGAVMEVSERVVNESVHSILKCFEKTVLPKYFGIDARDREFFLTQTAPIAELLYNINGKITIICDGTYLRHEKSSNNVYQRKSYSGQKKTPLCKPFTICTSNGYIVDLPGPFNANVNDAQILQFVLNDPDGISKILKPGDIFVLDRGFRDVVDFLKNKGYVVLMPALKGKRKQLTAEESNQSRFVTKLRWVIEATHGILCQKYRLLHHQFHNSMLPVAGLWCKIACFLQNQFGKRLNLSNEKTNIIVNRMKKGNVPTNVLAEKVSAANWSRKSVPFQTTTSEELLDFPVLTINELEVLFTGTYQLAQAISYLGEMITAEGVLVLKFVKEEPDIVRFDVRSRHIKSKEYKCYVQYDNSETCLDAILGYCCSCANGLRTVGCCSHVASLIYHLSYGRYLSKVIRPAEMLTNIFDINEIQPVIEEDSEED